MIKATKTSFVKRNKEILTALALLGVPMLFWLLLGLFPMLFGVGLSFLSWKGYDEPKFIWFDNYITFFTNKYYYMALVRTFLIGGLCFIASLISGVFVAAIVNSITKFKTFFRSVLYIPCVLSALVATLIFNIMLDPTNGLLNTILGKMNLAPVAWKNDTFWAVTWIVIYSTWKGLGGNVILWLAAFQSIDRTLDEAASLDGANTRQIFWKVRLPQMKPIIVYILITGFSGMMQIYEQILFITNGGPYGQTEVLAYRIMRDAFWDSNFGMSGASAVIMVICSFVFMLFAFRKQKEDMK